MRQACPQLAEADVVFSGERPRAHLRVLLTETARWSARDFDDTGTHDTGSRWATT
jgi:hypothetical protein